MTIFEDAYPVSERPQVLRVAILGASGSIGTQALDVCRQHPDRIAVTALSVFSSTEKLVRAAREFGVSHVAVADPAHGDDAVLSELPKDCELGIGDDAVSALCDLDDVDCVLVAVVGEAGIWACHRALVAGKVVACANKEALISGGDILMPLARPGRFIPVDSEHSAIFQCLLVERREGLSRIWLTCSGGPFYGRTRNELADVTSTEALAHPSWTMGPKITIDSATLMNKGLEVIEAHHLFDVPVDDVRVLVQPRSRIHSMVQFRDGSVIAQLGPSDMRIPIQLAFSYPERWDAPCEPVDFCSEEPLAFGRADTSTFRCLALAYEAGRRGGTLPCAMNAANEVANAAFRAGECGFLDIAGVVERVMDVTDVEKVESLSQLNDVDLLARERANDLLVGMR